MKTILKKLRVRIHYSTPMLYLSGIFKFISEKLFPKKIKIRRVKVSNQHRNDLIRQQRDQALIEASYSNGLRKGLWFFRHRNHK